MTANLASKMSFLFHYLDQCWHFVNRYYFAFDQDPKDKLTEKHPENIQE